MEGCFAEVLASETAHLAAVTDVETLRAWRRHLVDQLMTPRSPYARALSRSADAAETHRFLDRWQDLIAEMIRRLPRSVGGEGAADAHEIAALILATLHGGSVLSRVARCAGPLDSALDLALAPFLGAGRIPSRPPESRDPLDTMGSR